MRFINYNHGYSIYLDFILMIIISLIDKGSGINCFTCNSRNISDLSCHDPFHPANSTYNVHCKTGKKNHVGLFPANFCVKMKGISVSTKEELVIRSCSLTNMDNQCGTFKFDDEIMNGCIVTCSTDGCNHSYPTLSHHAIHHNFLIVFSLILTLLINK